MQQGGPCGGVARRSIALAHGSRTRQQSSVNSPLTNIPLDNSRDNEYCYHMKEARTRKSKPAFRPGPEERVFVSLLRTADALSRAGETLLKPHGLSATQYNTLRILRGAGDDGLACSEVGERLISRDPDITRLLDRMESRGLIARARKSQDRRVVKTRITEAGLRLLSEVDRPVQELHRRQLGHLAAREIQQLSNLLERARKVVEEARSAD